MLVADDEPSGARIIRLMQKKRVVEEAEQRTIAGQGEGQPELAQERRRRRENSAAPSDA